ncbi:hypothetical protein BX616_004675 [Lobosporangium transversale]|uniref:Fungal lipase-type domain-containing protein n=1 Tax=Lobosporangium transversale TaxID=64571 RepID=A0A1Y2GW96_9FUNG|nr:hypothetical protein BCR41DRAFT_420029 [Lobosporangium transversale]KAF9916075.1 hypothetical protein BX616_004675 [Lobosporangium transversale]ORZ26535.1 hypothetical protein BCR41DRAFT_420029 [Lobosporangium transversale]|eukprot:XP_021884300.1 hypothetical protein BCR41DRAFT_420029 [Lobosporangium transversale]
MTWIVDFTSQQNQFSFVPPEPAPEKSGVHSRHLQEFCTFIPSSSASADSAGARADRNKHHYESFSAPTSPTLQKFSSICCSEDHSNGGKAEHYALREIIPIKVMDFLNYLVNLFNFYIKSIRDPSSIPGVSLWSRAYALGALPVMTGFLVFIQGCITLAIQGITYTKLGQKAYEWLMSDQILLLDPTDEVDPNGLNEALKQLADTQPQPRPIFSYFLAHLLLTLSTVTYERDDELVRKASLAMKNMNSDIERAKAAEWLYASELSIDNKAQRLGMRFTGISELKTLGGPYAGLFYNNHAIVLVFKGTSPLAFNEFLIDGSIQRVDASEYLYGEVHKGFYEFLFPDPMPQTKQASYNPFQTIMETVFEEARRIKRQTGKPANLWITGHSLGAALAAIAVARMQMALRPDDPLFKDCDPATIRTHNSDGTPRTVLDEMLCRYIASASSPHSTFLSSAATFPLTKLRRHRHHHHTHHTKDGKGEKYKECKERKEDESSESDGQHDHQHEQHEESTDQLLILRDCYTFASPKIGNSKFAKEFDEHHVRFHSKSCYKPVLYRVAIDLDVVPRLPPGCSTDPDDTRERMFPCIQCANRVTVSQSSSSAAAIGPLFRQQADVEGEPLLSNPVSYGAVESTSTQTIEVVTAVSTTIPETSKRPPPSPHTHMTSLLDYRHVGQLVCLSNSYISPIVKPSELQSNLSANVLRTDKETQLLLDYIDAVLRVSEDDLCQEDSGNNDSNSSDRSNKSKDKAESFVKCRTFDAAKIKREMEKAKVRRDLDELNWLRVPCDAEKFLLTFSGVISHSPAAYQRNLVKSRYHFKSFPGPEMMQKLYYLQQQQQQTH